MPLHLPFSLIYFVNQSPSRSLSPLRFSLFSRSSILPISPVRLFISIFSFLPNFNLVVSVSVFRKNFFHVIICFFLSPHVFSLNFLLSLSFPVSLLTVPFIAIIPNCVPFSPFPSPISPLLFFLPLLVSRDTDLFLPLSFLFLYLLVSSFSLQPSFVVKPFPPSVNNSLSRILSLFLIVFLSLYSFYLPPSLSILYPPVPFLFIYFLTISLYSFSLERQPI